MSFDLRPLDDASRLLIEVELKVATGGGGRFQPTGFPDLGPALYKGADGNDWLLVESPQSMANRLETACWDEARECYDETCNGIPFIRSEIFTNKKTETPYATTSSVQESHRLASPFILEATIKKSGGGSNIPFWQVLKLDDKAHGLQLKEDQPFRLRNHASSLFQLDPGSLLHGVWLSTKVGPKGKKKQALCGGKVRFPRLLSGYIEAVSPMQANYGGVKRERVFDQASEGTTDSEFGFGSIPFPRSDYTSPEIKAYFSIDLQLLRSCALGNCAEKQACQSSKNHNCVFNKGEFTNKEAFLILWSLYKIEKFLKHGMALRSNCVFQCDQTSIKISEPSTFSWPEPGFHEEFKSLRDKLFPLIKAEDDEWKRRNVVVVKWQGNAPASTDTGGGSKKDQAGVSSA